MFLMFCIHHAPDLVTIVISRIDLRNKNRTHSVYTIYISDSWVHGWANNPSEVFFIAFMRTYREISTFFALGISSTSTSPISVNPSLDPPSLSSPSLASILSFGMKTTTAKGGYYKTIYWPDCANSMAEWVAGGSSVFSMVRCGRNLDYLPGESPYP